MEANKIPQKKELQIKLALGALCGSYACGGCYEIGDGKTIHPPRAGYDQAKLMEKD
jgi:hypothetical protein